MATGMNPMGMLDPSLPLMQQQAEQAQAYAAALRGQALTPIKTDDMVSGRVVRVSPLQPLAKMLMAYMGAKQQDEANTLTGGIAQRQSEMMRQLIGGAPSAAPAAVGPPANLAGDAPPAPQPASEALAAGAAAGSLGPTNANATRMADVLRQGPQAPVQAPQPMQPPSQQPAQGGAMAMPGMTTQQATAMMLMGGPEVYAKAFAERTDNRTPLVKALLSAGIDPNSEQGKTMLLAGVNKENYIAPTSLRPGGYVQNPNGSREQLPQVPEGSQATRGPDGQWQITPVPGGAEAISMLSGAKAAGTAPFQMVENFDPATGAPGKQFAGTTPGLIVPGVPGAAPVQRPAGAAPRLPSRQRCARRLRRPGRRQARWPTWTSCWALAARHRPASRWACRLGRRWGRKPTPTQRPKVGKRCLISDGAHCSSRPAKRRTRAAIWRASVRWHRRRAPVNSPTGSSTSIRCCRSLAATKRLTR